MPAGLLGRKRNTERIVQKDSMCTLRTRLFTGRRGGKIGTEGEFEV